MKDDVNDMQQTNIRLKMNAAPTDNVRIGLSVWSSRDEFGAPSVGDDDRTTKAAMDQPITADFDAYSLEVDVGFKAANFSSMTSYYDFDNLGLLDLTSLGVPGLGLETGFTSEVFAQEFVLTSAIESPWQWSAGVFYREVEDSNTSVFAIPGAIKANLYDESESYAIYGELGRRFADDRFAWTIDQRA